MDFDREIPFVRHLGFELVRFDGGEAEIAWSPRPEHLNYLGVTHGGSLMTVLDTALAHAARSVDPSLGVVTIEMKTTFMHPADGPLRATGRLLHRTRQMAFVEGRVTDARGQVCAHATGTFRYLMPPPPASA
ncbi:MAG: PaaI family thioesterase [Burkholderiaceae bacterium]|nr:PaaI family thioesterase [Burkholderiaceae bacterium]